MGCSSCSVPGCQVVLGPAEELGAEHGGVDGEPLCGVGGVVSGERLDSVEAVGDRTDRQVQSAGGFSGDTPCCEVGVECGQEGFGSAARLQELA